MSPPATVCIKLEKKVRDSGKPLSFSFFFETDIGRISFRGEGSLDEIVEMLPTQIENAGATYRIVKALMEMEAQP